MAIVAIVAAHTWSVPITFGEGRDPGRAVWVLWAATETLFHDSTILFTVISGLLVTLVLRGRRWDRFYIRKIVTVAVPYLVVSVLYATVRYRPADGPELADPTNAGYWTDLARDLLTGGAAIHLWYIPVLGVLFALTPALLRIVDSIRYRPVGVALILAPLVVSRHFPEVRPGTVVFFLGAYLAGLYIGADYERAVHLLRSRLPLLAATAAAASMLAFVLFMTDTNWLGPISVRESILYVQKMAVTGLLLVTVQRFRTRDSIPAPIDALAEHSFAIHLLHIYPIAAMTHWGLERFGAPQGWLLLAVLGLVQLVVTIPLLLGAAALARLGWSALPGLSSTPGPVARASYERSGDRPDA